MRRDQALTHQFVEYIPKTLEPGVVYVSLPYETAIHLCCCGCGKEVVTPLSKTEWKLAFDGKTISLYPSIGNWQFPCRSHYWIHRNKAVWVPEMSNQTIHAGRKQAQAERERYYGKLVTGGGWGGWWARLKTWWSQ
ncbi:MAG: hypothetical protein D4S02_01155 [Rhodocyclaceae bacterium]|nr:MAG: hypothetical protein D4S02_01155 [Rhodocyclaceae bacterium]